jgi:hypothetical protein
MVTAAGWILIVLGVLTLLLGTIGLLGALALAGATGAAAEELNVPGLGVSAAAFAGLFLVIIVIVLAWGAAELASGINVLSGRGWARILGIILAAIGLLLSLPGLGGGEGSSPILSIVLIAAYAFVIWALATAGSWFTARA